MNMLELTKKHSCEKIWHKYSELYEADFEHLRKKNINILEVGTFRGESLNVWLDYFTNANIYTIDTSVGQRVIIIMDFSKAVNEKSKSYAGKPVPVLITVYKDIKFDFIIDDGLHTPDGQRKTFENLIEFTDNYYIEDVWNLDKVNMNHPWIKSHANDFTKEKWHKLLESIGKYNVSHHDWRSKKKQDSYILKIWKHT